jgi:Na+-transporting methylmalonyl-CoA/oxaloacetate decarboxylase gamma subunit
VAIRDAIVVSLVGMGVVFFGLLVTSWLISAIALVPAWVNRRRQAPAPPAPPQSAAPARDMRSVSPPPAPDVLAVISALLEVEMRLHGGARSGRFTFRRDASAGHWRLDAAMPAGQPDKGAR